MICQCRHFLYLTERKSSSLHKSPFFYTSSTTCHETSTGALDAPLSSLRFVFEVSLADVRKIIILGACPAAARRVTVTNDLVLLTDEMLTFFTSSLDCNVVLPRWTPFMALVLIGN